MSEPVDKQADAAALAAWAEAAARSAPGGKLDALNWITPEGISRQAAVHRGRPARPAAHRHAAGLCALHSRPAGHDVRGAAVDDPPVRRLFHRRGEQCLLPPGAGRRRARRERGLRPGHPPRLRQRPPARHRRRRQGGGGHRFGRGHEDPVRRHSARQGQRVDDDERRGAADPGRLRGGGRRAGRAAGQAVRDHPERHPQGVHGPQHLHLPARTFDAHHRRHHRVHGAEDAEVQLDQHQRLSHAGSRRQPGAGAGLHAGRRQGIREDRAGQGPGRGRLRRPLELLLGDRHELLSRDRQDARGAAAVVPHHAGLRRARRPRA